MYLVISNGDLIVPDGETYADAYIIAMELDDSWSIVKLDVVSSGPMSNSSSPDSVTISQIQKVANSSGHDTMNFAASQNAIRMGRGLLIVGDLTEAEISLALIEDALNATKPNQSRRKSLYKAVSAQEFSDFGDIPESETPSRSGKRVGLSIRNDDDSGFTYDDAVLMARSMGARLPRPKEYRRRMLVGTGYGFDQQMCWTTPNKNGQLRSIRGDGLGKIAFNSGDERLKLRVMWDDQKKDIEFERQPDEIDD